jgi:hypothetical protein
MGHFALIVDDSVPAWILEGAEEIAAGPHRADGVDAELTAAWIAFAQPPAIRFILAPELAAEIIDTDTGVVEAGVTF